MLSNRLVKQISQLKKTHTVFTKSLTQKIICYEMAIESRHTTVRFSKKYGRGLAPLICGSSPLERAE